MSKACVHIIFLRIKLICVDMLALQSSRWSNYVPQEICLFMTHLKRIIIVGKMAIVHEFFEELSRNITFSVTKS